jgi:hypothetical protein
MVIFSLSGCLSRSMPLLGETSSMNHLHGWYMDGIARNARQKCCAAIKDLAKKAVAFLKKYAKKIFIFFLPGDVDTSRLKTNKSFWGAFFQKGAPFSLR